MLVTVCFGKDMVKFNKSTFGIQTRITSFFEDSEDRSVIPASLLDGSNLGYLVTIEEKEHNLRIFDITADVDNKTPENEYNHKAVYESICGFLQDHSGVSSLFLDTDYKVFCFKVAEKYIPYKLADRVLTPLTLPNVRAALGNLKDGKIKYIILTFGDTIKIVDTWNSYHLVYILVKSFIENKFPLFDKKRLDKSSIVSFDGFFLTYIYISNIVGSKIQFKDTVKRGYDNLSKMNMLAHIPQESWIIEENYKNLKVDRLKKFIVEEKKTFAEKVKDILSDEKDEVDIITGKETVNEFVPTYFSHIFNENSVVMGWKDFIEMFTGNEVHGNNRMAVIDGLPDDADSIIIVPDEDIGNLDFSLKKEDIIFMGLNEQTLYFALKSYTGKKECTPEETLLAQKLDDYILTNFYLETNVEYDSEDCEGDNCDIKDSKTILLDAGG